MGKYFFSPEDRDGQFVRLTGSKAHHLANVMRLRIGDEITLCDGMGSDFRAKLENIKRSDLLFLLLTSVPSEIELPFPITLFQGVPKGDKMDWIIGKAVEMGVSKIVPVRTEHSEARIEDTIKKRLRYERVALAAAAQSMRGCLPIIESFIDFHDALCLDSQSDISLVAHEKENIQTIKSALQGKSSSSISIWVGPEGGFSVKEVDKFISKKLACVSLGKRILRCETAGLVALSQIIYEWYL